MSTGSVCKYCRDAALWASLPLSSRTASPLTAHRPSTMGSRLTIDHHPTAVDFLDSAGSCCLCQTLSKCIPQNEPWRSDFLREHGGWAVKLVCSRVDRSLVTCLEAELWSVKEGSHFAGFGVRSTIAVCNGQDLLARRAIWTSQAPAFTDRLVTIRNWVEDCQMNHGQCAESSPTRYPARFLDLGTGNMPDSIRLIPLEDIGVSSARPLRYVALSHCWGPPAKAKAMFKTMRANYESNLQGVPLGPLSRTFQDAIRVTVALDARYLWIDSLCIIQDDKDDWTVEAAKMADIYRGAWLTIAATSAEDGSGGLFLDSLTPAVCVDLGPTSGKQHGFLNGSTEGNSHSYFARCQAASRGAILDAPLSQRAWVLQEQVLSPRLVHFTESQMFYQCRAGLESEDGTVKDAQFTSLRAKGSVTDGGGDDLGLVNLSSPVLSMESWWSWVAEYASRSLTFHDDRMPAIAGIVEYYGTLTSDVSILGLWKRSLWYDLSWQVDSRRPRTSGAAGSQRRLSDIPTWSWLSLRPGVAVRPMLSLQAQRSQDYANKVELVSWESRWEAAPYTSKLGSTKLRVWGSVMQLTVPLPLSRARDECLLDFEAEWDAFLDVHIVLDYLLRDENERQAVVLLLLFADPIYEYVLALKRDESADPAEAGYRRLGAGLINRPRGHPGFFKDASRIELTLV